MFTTRPATEADVELLWEMLFQSLHRRPGSPPFDRDVLAQPEIAHYLTDFFAQPGDDAQIAVASSGVSIGAAWVRVLPETDPGYGFVAPGVPEMGMAVEAAWRGRGVGTRLVQDLHARHPVMSLSVDDDNRGAVALYQRLGFIELWRDATSITMIRRESEPPGN